MILPQPSLLSFIAIIKIILFLYLKDASMFMTINAWLLGLWKAKRFSYELEMLPYHNRKAVHFNHKFYSFAKLVLIHINF